MGHTMIPKGKPNIDLHCLHCWSPLNLCICSLAAPIKNRLPVQVFMHHKEASRKSNSSHLLKLTLSDIDIQMHGVKNRPTAWPSKSDESPICVLFPTENAKELSSDDQNRFSRLVLLDGNWRQAKKASNRIAKYCHPEFRRLPKTMPSEFRLRKQSAHDRLSTYEAAVRALMILENPNYGPLMLPLFRAHVEVTMEARSRRGTCNE